MPPAAWALANIVIDIILLLLQSSLPILLNKLMESMVVHAANF